MKPPVAVTLIIMGGLIVMTPAISDYFYQSNVVALMSARRDFSTVTIEGKMGDSYRVACWLTGTVMICFATFCSLCAGKNREA
jgi:hypothetical protein